MKTINDIPVYAAEIANEIEGMLRISLVDDPAVETNFLTFSKDKPMQMFAVQNEEKRLVYGVLMRADFPIYRYSEEEGEYYMVFSKDVIRTMAEKYLSESRQNKVNLQHIEGTEIQGAEMVQMFIKDSEKGITPTGFDDVADGSLFAEYHITNDEVWEDIKKGTYKGFSLEGYFSLKPAETFKQQHKKENMAKTNRFKAFLASILAKFANTTTDKGVIAWDGDEELKVGDEVYIQDEQGEMQDIEDGDYTKEDGTIIRVKDGKVEEIVEKEDTPKEGEETEEVKAKRQERFEAFKKRREELSSSFMEKEKAYWDALLKESKEFAERGCLESAGDDFLIASVWDKDYTTSNIYRYPVYMEEDGKITFGERVEVKRAFIPIDQEFEFSKQIKAAEEEVENPTNEGEESDTEAIVKLREEMDEAYKRIDALEKAIEEIRGAMTNMSAAAPAHEDFEGQAKEKLNDKNLEKVVNAFARLRK